MSPAEMSPRDKWIYTVARAIQICTDGFEDPVHFYIQNEAWYRYQKDHPDADREDMEQQPDFSWVDESYKIIARDIWATLVLAKMPLPPDNP